MKKEFFDFIQKLEFGGALICLCPGIIIKKKTYSLPLKDVEYCLELSLGDKIFEEKYDHPATRDCRFEILRRELFPEYNPPSPTAESTQP